jgi:hypothetical protein
VCAQDAQHGLADGVVHPRDHVGNVLCAGELNEDCALARGATADEDLCVGLCEHAAGVVQRLDRNQAGVGQRSGLVVAEEWGFRQDGAVGHGDELCAAAARCADGDNVLAGGEVDDFVADGEDCAGDLQTWDVDQLVLRDGEAVAGDVEVVVEEAEVLLAEGCGVDLDEDALVVQRGHGDSRDGPVPGRDGGVQRDCAQRVHLRAHLHFLQGILGVDGLRHGGCLTAACPPRAGGRCSPSGRATTRRVPLSASRQSPSRDAQRAKAYHTHAQTHSRFSVLPSGRTASDAKHTGLSSVGRLPGNEASLGEREHWECDAFDGVEPNAMHFIGVEIGGSTRV